jgi:hypothetical protein
LSLLQLLLAFVQGLIVVPLSGLQLFYLLSHHSQFPDEQLSAFVFVVHRN